MLSASPEAAEIEAPGKRAAPETKMAPAVHGEEEAEAPQRTSPAASQGRKYPTLARMAAIAPRAEIEAPANDEAPAPERAEPGDAEPSAAADDFGADMDDETFDEGNEEAGENLGDYGRDSNDMAGEAKPAQVSLDTWPIAAMPPREPRRPVVVTRRLASLHETPEAMRTRRARPYDADLADDGLVRALMPGSRPRPLPEASLILPLAGVHAAMAALLSLLAVALLLNDAPMGGWLLALTLIIGVGGGLGYALAQRDYLEKAAGVALLFSQLGALAWAMVVLGPRASLLLFVPAMTLLALRSAGRVPALLGVCAAGVTYAVCALLAPHGGLLPVFHLSDGALTLVDGALVSVGLITLAATVVDAQAGRLRAEAVARGRRHELRMLRAREGRLRQQAEDDAEQLEDALALALRGHGIGDRPIEALDAPLAERVMAVADRLQTLQRDREERMRLEGAIRGVIRAVERAWLGLAWTWPEPSGTAVDELVALLRTPSPREGQSTPSNETPTLVPIPSLDTTPLSRPHAVIRPLHQNGVSSGSGAWPKGRMGGDTPPLQPATPLPWNEWDTWKGWDPS
jgi:hypothetical protein